MREEIIEPRVARIARSSRRSFLVFLAMALCFSASTAEARAQGKDLVYVGTYTGPNKGQGIYGYRFDRATGQLSSLGLVAESESPSFLAVDPSRRFLYASNEIDHYEGQASGAVSAFAIDRASGKLSFLNEVSAHDPGSAHVVVDFTGKDVLISNYTRGSVAVFPLLDGGRLGEASDFVRHQGSSVNPQRQQGPHAHSIALSPDDRFAIAADLGLDQLVVYPLDPAKGKLGTPHVVKIHPGSGPRHMTFDPGGKFLYLLGEMASTVTVFSYAAAEGGLRERQTISTLPQGFSGESTGAEIQIHPTGKFVYASNRGDDSLAVFRVDHARGTLRFLERVATGGKTPRNFAIDPSGSWLLAANQNSNDIVVFRIDPKSGRLTPSGQVVQLAAPVCVVFVPLP
jgi:6-phosphogluconolactonase